MFSRYDQLKKRTPKDGVDRKEFINLLVEEFLHTKSFDAKCQVLANLSNFAYDPINYAFLRDSGAIDIFLSQLEQSDSEILIHFACSAICNLCLDPVNADYIFKYDGLKLLTRHLSSEHEETKLDVITSLIYLAESAPRQKLNNSEVLNLMLRYKQSENIRLKNLATIFLNDVFTSDAIEKCINDNDKFKEVSDIPLPTLTQ